MIYIMAIFTLVQALFGVLDIFNMMFDSYDFQYCSISWGWKCFVTNYSACLGCVYMYNVKKRIEDPMNQKFFKEVLLVIITFGLAFLLSYK